MPAHDSCEPNVVRALEKAGWKILYRPYRIRLIDGGFLFADLMASSEPLEKYLMVVEVKCFPGSSTALEEFYKAVGQYTTYRRALRDEGTEADLFLAVPLTIYATLLQEHVIQGTIQDAQVQLIVCDMEAEEIVRWHR